MIILGCIAAKKNPGVQEGEKGLHVHAGDAIADPQEYITENDA